MTDAANRTPPSIEDHLREELAQARAERDGWMETAREYASGLEFYRDLVTSIGEPFGAAARTSDDGSVQDSVLALRVPELMEAQRAQLAAVTAERDRLLALLKPTDAQFDKMVASVEDHVDAGRIDAIGAVSGVLAALRAGITDPSSAGSRKKTEPGPLTFAALRAVDVERCNTAFGPTNKLMDWSPADWMCALAGEVGEAANFIKKMRRGDYGDNGAIANVAKELADVTIYVDLLAARLGIDLGAAVVAKFNEVSDRVDSPIRLPVRTTETQLAPAGEGPGAGTISPQPVPYGHCNRCPRCGAPLAGVEDVGDQGWNWPLQWREGCWADRCFAKPTPPLLTHCAGCGAPFETDETKEMP